MDENGIPGHKVAIVCNETMKASLNFCRQSSRNSASQREVKNEVAAECGRLGGDWWELTDEGM